MKPLNLIVLLGLLVHLVGQPLAAQVRKKIPLPKIEREWSEDEQGLWQWQKFEQTCFRCRGAKRRDCEYCKHQERDHCVACGDKKVTVCRVCAGKGKLPDPLLVLMCPYCQGITWHPCRLCAGHGSFPVKGGGKKNQTCSACKKLGSHKCTACKGKHHLAVVKVGKHGPGKASVKDLKQARSVLQKSLESLEKLELTAKEGKTLKAFLKTIKKSAKILAAIKDMQGLLKKSLKGLRKGAAYTSYGDNVLAEFAHFKDRSIYLLRHQILLLNICLKRAEHNESMIAKQEAAAKKK